MMTWGFLSCPMDTGKTVSKFLTEILVKTGIGDPVEGTLTSFEDHESPTGRSLW